jgi:2-polyprenyl-3-methyl-5-hydroxy-6-metoxy-1,4-benzoquinol methylase
MGKLLHFLIKGDEEEERIHRDFSRLLRAVAKANNLLDVGCADGGKTVQYAENLNIPGENIYGIEIFDKYIEIAKNRLHVTKLNLEQAPFPMRDEVFEVVTCNQILEHLKNVFLPLSEMERVLKTGGYLAIGIPNLAALHNRILLALGYQPVCNAITGPHIRCFTHKAFLKFLRSNSNFSLIGMAGSSLYPFPYPIVEFGAYLFPGLSAYTFYLLKKIRHNPQGSSWRVSSIGDTCL